MRYIISGTAFLLIPMIVRGIIEYIKQPEQKEKGEVYLPPFFAMLGAVSSAIFLIPSVLTVFLMKSWGVSVLLLLLSALAATLVIASVNCRISYDQDGFVHKSFFGITRKFTYDQVTAIKENMHETIVYVGKKRLMLDEFAIGADVFMKLVKKKYRTMHDGRSIPKISKAKHDIFKGNVQDTGGFLFAYISVGVMVAGFLIFVVYTTYIPRTPNNTIERSLSFMTYEKSKEEIILTTGDHQIFKISFVDEQFDENKIQAICDGETLVTTYSLEVTPKEEQSYHSLKAVKYQNDYILTFDETNRMCRQGNRLLVGIAVTMFILWGTIVVFSIIIGRNPQKFSEEVIGLFFKDGYVRR